MEAQAGRLELLSTRGADSAAFTTPLRARNDALAAGIVSFSVAILAAPSLLTPIFLILYDEGIALSAGTFIAHGRLPHRDFWLLYGPLAGYLVAGVQGVVSNDLIAFRLVGLVITALQGAVCYLLARLFTGRLPAGLLAIGAALAPFTLAVPDVTSWSAGMLAASLALLLASRSGARSKTFAGPFLGIAFLCRRDLGGYALVASFVAWRDRRILLGFVAVALPVAALLAFSVPWSDLISQLVWYPIVGPRQFRSMPAPVPWDPPSGSSWYQVFVFWYVPLIAIAVAAFQILRNRRLGGTAVALIVFALLCQLEVVGRADLSARRSGLCPRLDLSVVLDWWISTPHGIEIRTPRCLDTLPRCWHPCQH